jgi:lipoate-protein ligase B
LADLLDLGLVGYSEAWGKQRDIHAEVLNGTRDDTLIFVEHPPVLSLGASFHEENLLLPRAEYTAQGIEIVQTDRGGDVTYHGPGQLVIYPIFDLRRHGKDLHLWLRNLEAAIIRACQEFNLSGTRSAVNTGVWINDRKVAAIGIKVSRWVSLHGIALNCNNDLTPFDSFIPCGIKTHGVTSLTQEAKVEIPPKLAKPAVIRAFESVFDLTFA